MPQQYILLFFLSLILTFVTFWVLKKYMESERKAELIKKGLKIYIFSSGIIIHVYFLYYFLTHI